MKTLRDIIVIMVVVIAVLFVKHKFFPTVIDESTHTVDTLWQDSIIKVKLPAPAPDTFRYPPDTVTIPADSLELVRKYLALHREFFARFYYRDTLKDDSAALIIVQDTISQNRLKSRFLTYQNRTPTLINNYTTIQDRRMLFFGGQIGRDILQPQVTYKDLKGMQYFVGYDFVGPEQGVRLGVSFEVGIPFTN